MLSISKKDINWEKKDIIKTPVSNGNVQRNIPFFFRKKKKIEYGIW